MRWRSRTLVRDLRGPLGAEKWSPRKRNLPTKPERVRLIRERSDRSKQPCQGGEGAADRVHDPIETSADPYQGARREGVKIERRVIEYGPRLGIGGEEDLEAAVQAKALDRIRPDAPPDAVRRL
jgi:hypothetical protein